MMSLVLAEQNRNLHLCLVRVIPIEQEVRKCTECTQNSYGYELCSDKYKDVKKMVQLCRTLLATEGSI